jgi:hypothetical protein
MTIAGLPLHPLVVHAAVVLVPLAAVAALAYALVPRWRWVLRHPTLVIGLAAAAAVQVAAMTGDSLKASLGEAGHLIAVHEMWAGRLQAATWVLAVLVAGAWWLLPHGSPLPAGDRRSPVSTLIRPVTVALPLLAVTVVVLVVLTGDAGARAVWAAQGR